MTAAASAVPTATVSALTYYPVKGCAGVSVATARVGTTGLTFDRMFMLVDAAEGSFLSQRKRPGMAVIRPTVLDGGERLVLSAPDTDDAEVDVRTDGPRIPVSLFNKWFGAGIDQGDAVAKWASAVLGVPARLVRVPLDHDRDGWGEHPGKVAFADAHAISVAGQSSLDHLNDRIRQRGAEPVPMNRFRCNIVLTGWPQPHTEDLVRRMTIGTVELGYSTRAIRCAVPTVSQETGERRGPEPTRTLADYRREPEFGGGVSFAMKAAVLHPGELAVGDQVAVQAWAD
jgi:uncharacterized protein